MAWVLAHLYAEQFFNGNDRMFLRVDLIFRPDSDACDLSRVLLTPWLSSISSITFSSAFLKIKSVGISRSLCSLPNRFNAVIPFNPSFISSTTFWTSSSFDESSISILEERWSFTPPACSRASNSQWNVELHRLHCPTSRISKLKYLWTEQVWVFYP